MKVAKNDLVLVISGDDRDKRGKVLRVFPAKQRVLVEGVHFIKRHTRPSQSNPKGGIVEKEAPIHISNVMVVCPKCNEPTKIGSKILEGGRRTRQCKQCGEIFD
ncbi:MAG: 50S ribosomal protein L24 [Gemmatimonadota bacterium]|nr:MAG: 50S ribosomal protein L24 [Gemmatimonadota bacterium]